MLFNRLILILIAFVSMPGCVTPAPAPKPTRYLFATKENQILFLSKSKISFALTIDDSLKWKSQKMDVDHSILKQTIKPEAEINIYQIESGPQSQQYYKAGFSESDAILAYVDSQGKALAAKNLAVTIVSTDFTAPVLPNIYWVASSSRQKIYNVVFSKNRNLINISYEVPGSVKATPDRLFKIIRSIEFLTPAEIDLLVK